MLTCIQDRAISTNTFINEACNKAFLERGELIPFKKYQKEIFIISFIIVLIISFLVIRPFLPAVILGAVIAYVFHPIFSWFEAKLKNKPLCAVLTLLLIALIFSLPMVFVFKSVISEISSFYTMMDDGSIDLFNNGCHDSESSFLCGIKSVVNAIIPDGYLNENLNNSLLDIYMRILEFTSSLILVVPIIIINILIVVFVIFYLFAEWDIIVHEIDVLLPFKEDIKLAFAKQARDIIHATIYGNIIIAIVQGTLGAIAFIIFDSTKLPIMWGMIMAIAAFIPFIGTAIVWLPVGLIQVFTGYAAGSEIVIWKGIGLLLVGALIISTIDNILKPKIIGRRASIHPILVLLGLLGGIKLFGFIGVIVGPLVMALMVAFIRVYKKEKNALVG